MCIYICIGCNYYYVSYDDARGRPRLQRAAGREGEEDHRGGSGLTKSAQRSSTEASHAFKSHAVCASTAYML